MAAPIDRDKVHRLYRELVAVSTFYRTEISRVMTELSQELGLPRPAKFSQYDILCELYHRGESTPTQISKVVGLTLPNVSNAIAELCELGLVERVADDGDRRKSIVRTTELGRRFGDEILSRCPDISCVLYRSPRDVDDLLAHFDAIEQNIAAYQRHRQESSQAGGSR